MDIIQIVFSQAYNSAHLQRCSSISWASPPSKKQLILLSLFFILALPLVKSYADLTPTSSNSTIKSPDVALDNLAFSINGKGPSYGTLTLGSNSWRAASGDGIPAHDDQEWTGPLPPGTYYVEAGALVDFTDHPNVYAYKLDPAAGTVLLGRSGFYIHPWLTNVRPPGINYTGGCIGVDPLVFDNFKATINGDTNFVFYTSGATQVSKLTVAYAVLQKASQTGTTRANK